MLRVWCAAGYATQGVPRQNRHRLERHKARCRRGGQQAGAGGHLMFTDSSTELSTLVHSHKQQDHAQCISAQQTSIPSSKELCAALIKGQPSQGIEQWVTVA